MANRQEVDVLVGKVMTGPEFRAEFMKDPTAAAKGLGIELDPDQEAALKNNLQAMVNAAADLDHNQVTAPGGHLVIIQSPST